MLGLGLGLSRASEILMSGIYFGSVFSYRPRLQLNFMPSGFLSFERFRISPKWFPRTRFPLAMSFVSLAAFPPVPQSQSKQIGNKFSGVSSPSSA